MAAPQPTLAGFQDFITTVMKVPTEALPLNSPFIAYAFANALALVNPALRAVPVPQQDAAGASLNSGGWTIYAIAVYNLAASNLISYAPDQDGFLYFTALREKLNINGFISGIVQSSSDDGTSVNLVVQEAAKAFTLANLQQLKDPYGRAYLALAQSYGPTTWGLT